MKSFFLLPTVIYTTLLFWGQSLVAQNVIKPHPDAVQIALNYLSQLQKTGDLTTDDVQNILVQDHYADDNNGLSHIYIIQQHAGISLHNAIFNVNVLASGEILYVGNRFVKNLSAIVNTAEPAISPSEAVGKAFANLSIFSKTPLSIKSKNGTHEFVFDKGESVLNDIKVELVYQKINKTSVRLAWDMNVEQVDGQHYWQMRIDAVTGEVLEKNNLAIGCQFDNNSYIRLLKGDEKEEKATVCIEAKNTFVPAAIDALMPPVGAANAYRVFPLPAESPLSGTHTLVTNPADPTASPFGWHDTNGAAGAEYTITRGNNVHAYADPNEINRTSNDEPNGGSDLNFDFSYNATAEPDSNKKAAIVNLFYINNMMHDLSYYYGFTEAAGNFQQTNYSGAPGNNDYVQAEALDGKDVSSNTTICPSGCVNNANFATPADGSAPRMQMYVWQQQGGKNASIIAPSNLIGSLETASADFGTQISTTAVTGDVVIVNDGTTSPTLGCNALVNSLTGKIALVDRGTCAFAQKAINAQTKGAIGLLVCNVDDAINIRMTADATLAPQVHIPLLMIKKSDCDRIRLAAGSGLRISFVNANSNGPTLLDGDFDNGIISHEYTHGISSRLTGGRLNASCLGATGSEEQAGEGWSDFLALAFTAKPSDRGTDRRAVGAYATRSAAGVRSYPYSTDMTINPLTYDDIIIQNEVHSTGAIWCAAVWDLYWAMTDLYGFDANFKNANSGNGRAVRLVIDAMKIQPCNPGFLDARDAILAADRADFAGANQCLIWDVFARRGMGYNANQGLSESKFDNTEGYDKYPLCVKKLKITKKATEIIKTGDQISYTIQIVNQKGAAATNVVVTDEVPSGATYVAGSANRTATLSGSILSFNIGTMNNGDTVTLTYKATSDPTKKSIASFYDNFEHGDNNWDLNNLGNVVADNLWGITSTKFKSGSKAYAVQYPSTDMKSDQVVYTKTAIPISGTQPVLRFWHNYDTEPGFDGGIVQTSTDNGASWYDLGDKFFKNPYRGKLDYGTFSIANSRAWWGQSNNWIDSYADLSSFVGKSVQFRFRFGTDSLVRATGWFVDDVTVMDMINYNGKASVTSAQGDTATALLAARGTIVDPSVFTPTDETTEGGLNLRVYPNPSHNFLNINILGSETANADIQIISVDGRQMWSRKITLIGKKEELLPVDMSDFPSGLYIVKMSTDKKVLVEKIIKQ